MKKQELIKHIEDLPYKEGPIVDKIDISRKGLLELVKQLDEPEKVTIPQFVADWIEEARETTYNIRGAIEMAPNGRVKDWLELKNVNIFAEAWVNGYGVEKEKRYLVKMKGMNRINGCLAYNKKLGTWYFGISGNSKNHSTNHTRKELEEAGFSWVFDCEGIKIEEVKDE